MLTGTCKDMLPVPVKRAEVRRDTGCKVRESLDMLCSIHQNGHILYLIALAQPFRLVKEDSLAWVDCIDSAMKGITFQACVECVAFG